MVRIPQLPRNLLTLAEIYIESAQHSTYENILPIDARGFDSVTDLSLITVHGSSIDMPITQPQSCLYGLFNFIRLRLLDNNYY